MSRRNLQRVALCLTLAVGSMTTMAWAVDSAGEKPSAPGADSAPQAKSGRGVNDIMQDFQSTGQELRQVLSSPAALVDEAKRTEVAPKIVPILKKMNGYVEELKQTGDPQGKKIGEQVGPQLQTFLAVFDDKDTLDALDKQSKSSDKDEAIGGQSALLMAQWIKASHDAAAQEKILAESEKLAKANPDNDHLSGVLSAMAQIGPSSPEIADKITDVATGMNTQTAKMMKDQVADERKMKSMENKPLVLEGVRPDGSKFTTADWKGKVIFVDFWATWCGPCRAELPRVKKAYADYHDKGLEVLGVSCDNEAKDLDAFLTENKDMPWPQLFDAKNPGWHALATSYGIKGIPTMFLIDKKGVLRSVTARENFEEMIPKLLAEKVD